jgi:hypothetical protein
MDMKKYSKFAYLGAALVLVLMAVAYFGREGYQPEFLDQSNVQRTQVKAKSSYDQSTNAVRPDGRFEAPPIQGMKSPFRVNIWDSYIP